MLILQATKMPSGATRLVVHIDESKVLPDPAYVREFEWPVVNTGEGGAQYAMTDEQILAETKALCEAELAKMAGTNSAPGDVLAHLVGADLNKLTK